MRMHRTHLVMRTTQYADVANYRTILAYDIKIKESLTILANLQFDVGVKRALIII